MTQNHLSPSEQQFVDRAIKRSRVFLILMWIGLSIGLLLLAHTIYLAISSPGGADPLRWILAILILLNARQNLRQHKYAEALRKTASPLLSDERSTHQ